MYFDSRNLYDLNYKVLTDDEQRDLLKEFREKSCKKSFDKLILSNLKFVYHISKNYNFSYISFDDIFSVGVIGLIKAIDKFNLNFNNSFCTFASYYIRNEVIKYLDNNSSLFRFSTNKKYKKLLHNLNRYCSSFETITPEEIENLIRDNPEYTKEEVEKFFNAISENYLNDEDFSEIETEKTPEENLSLDEYEKNIYNFNNLFYNSSLHDRDKDILRMRYFENLSLREISEKLGISKERVRQLEVRSLKKLKNELNKKGFIYEI
jgi:RNA polymerase sigma factor (sigma-70 family)